MPTISWPGWGIVVGAVLAVIFILFRYRDTLLQLKNLITEIVGVIVLMSGLFLYATAVPQWLQMHDEIAQLAPPSAPSLSDHVQTLYTLYFGSISLMMLGGLLTAFAIFGRVASRAKR